jgi:hypothetical protein
MNLIYVVLQNSCNLNTYVAWQGSKYELSEDDTVKKSNFGCPRQHPIFVVCKISSCGDSDKIKTPCCVFVLLFSSYLRLYTWHIFIIIINNHNPTEGIPTLTQWWGLRGQMILRAVLVVVWLLLGPPMPDRSKVMTQTKRDTLVLQVGGWVWGWPHPIKNISVEKLIKS